MGRHARIIFYLILLVVGVQWLGDPVDERLNPSSELTAAWNDVDDADVDDSHSSGLFLTTDFAFSLPDMPKAGLGFFGWLLPASDPTNLCFLVTSHQFFRAPPAA